MVNLLKVGFTNKDVEDWKGCFCSSWQIPLVSLFDVYGEVKMTVSIAELVDRWLQVIIRIAGSSIVICILELCDGSGTSMFM